MTWQRVGRAVGTVSVGGVLVAVAQSPTGLALTPIVGPAAATALAALTGLAVMVVLTMLVLVLTSAFSRDPVRQENAAATVDLIVYAVHRRCRPDLDLAPPVRTRRQRRTGSLAPARPAQEPQVRRRQGRRGVVDAPGGEGLAAISAVPTPTTPI